MLRFVIFFFWSFKGFFCSSIYDPEFSLSDEDDDGTDLKSSSDSDSTCLVLVFALRDPFLRDGFFVLKIC